MDSPEDRLWMGSPIGRISGVPQKPTCPHSRCQPFANAAIAASRVGSWPWVWIALAATALRLPLQQHTRHVYAVGTFIAYESRVAHSWLDAHHIVHGRSTPRTWDAGLRP
jgi:hypothetical protein